MGGGGWRNLESKMADQYSRRLEIMTEFPRHVTSSTHDADLKENNFRRTIHPQSFIAVAFIFSELEREASGAPLPPVEKVEKKARSGYG